MMSLRCQEVATFLADYLDGALGTEQRTVFEAHVAACRECVDYLRGYAETLRLVRETGRDDPEPARVPEDLIAAILAARSTRPG